jgi:hypothetical protein
MRNSSLPEFVGKVLAHNRIGYGDLRRLQRDILPNGITTRAEAEALIGLDQTVTRVDDGWPGFLAAAVTEFVVSGSTPQGCIDRETAEWLVLILSGMEARTALGIAREIVQEAQQINEVLLAFACKSPKRKSKAVVSNLECIQDPSSEPSAGPHGLVRASYEWSSISVSWREMAEAGS